MAREICEIVVLKAVGGEPHDVVAGRFILENGKVTYDAEPGYKQMFSRIQGDPVGVKGKDMDVRASEQPALWFHNLPAEYHGAYMWARMVS